MSSVKFVNNIKRKLLYPFDHDLTFMVLLWGMISLGEVIVQMRLAGVGSAVFCLLANFCIAYVIVFICDLNKVFSIFLKPLIYFIITIFTCLNLYCLYFYHTRLDNNILETITQTNIQEAREYFSMYIGWLQYLYLIFFLLVAGFLYWLAVKPLKYGIRKSGLWCCLLIGCSAAAAVSDHGNSYKETGFFSFERSVDLSKYPTYPKVGQSEIPLPDKLVIVIGESHSRSHSSLYGYPKLTNPLMAKRQQEGNLIVFDSVNSIGFSTTKTFKYILNTASPSDSIPWYKSTHLIEVLKTAGYHTSWISNQIRKGIYDNVSSAPSKLCDESIFISETGDQYRRYDDELGDVNLNDQYHKRAIFYHLMGQHEVFRDRYPSGFNKFDEKDYTDLSLSPKNRKTLSEYDNATLYNDFVIDKIISNISGSDAILIYFPDHGLDVFESGPDFCGHAKNIPESRKAALEIPMFVFLSDKFIEKRPEISKRLRSSTGNKMVTDKLIYTVMDILGLRFLESDDVKKYSILTDYSHTRLQAP